MNAAELLVQQTWARVLPAPPRLRPSVFADQELVVTTGPLAGARWRTLSYQRAILDAFEEPGIQYVIVMGGAQWGKTALAIAALCYHIAHDPCPCLVVMPTVTPMARDFARNRLDPVIDASPALSKVVAKRRQKGASNTTLLKTFRGGTVALAGANSSASLSARSVRFLCLDEVERFPLELAGEGSTIEIALKRTATYGRRRRVLMTSTPTLRGGLIERWYLRGDQRKFRVPCPVCHERFAFEWSQVRWRDADPTSARIHCPHCDHGLDDAARRDAVELGAWEATATATDSSVVSFHLWEAYSPFSSLSQIVSGFLRAREAQKAGDASEMHVWENTTLGEPVEPEDGESVAPHVLLARREQYKAPVPAGAVVLTAGVDTQDDRLEAAVLGWGPGEESWWIDRLLLPGDPARPEVWEMLDAVLMEPYRHESGAELRIEALALDTAGHRTDHAYEWVSRRQSRRVFGVIGRDGQRPLVSSPSQQKIARTARTVQLYTVGVDTAKALWLSRLNLSEKGPGYVHIPMADWADEEFAEQLSSEYLVTRFEKGHVRHVWKKRRPRNECWDIAQYGLAALRLLHPDLERRAAQLNGGAK